MPADIATIENEPAIAYQDEMPWHKLGTRMIGQPDVHTALEAAHLDWNVVLKSLYYKHSDKTIKVPNRRAVVRDTDGALLSTVGSDYVPMQNREAFEVLQPACKEFGLTIDVAGALGKGDRVWMLAKMPNVIEPIPGDKIHGYCLVLTGHNGWTCHSARLTETRVVCANTLALAMKDQAFTKLRHVEGADEQLDQVARMITAMVASMTATSETFTQLARRRMTADEIKQYVSYVLNVADEANPVAERRRARIIQLVANGKGSELAPNTAWAAYNAVTEYLDHVRPAEARSPRTIAQANASALFGANAKVKVRALLTATKLAA